MTVRISNLPSGQGVGRAAFYRRAAPTVISAANYTLTADDDGRVLRMESESTQVVTVPASLPAGFTVTLIQGGASFAAGRLRIESGVGVETLMAPWMVGSEVWGSGRGAQIHISRLTPTLYAVAGDLYLSVADNQELADAFAAKANVGQAQPIARWSYANAAARDAFTYTSADIGYVARVESPLGFFRLAGVNPLVWESIGVGSGGGGAIGRGPWSARPSTPSVGDYYLCTDLPRTELRCWSEGVWTTYVCGVEVEPRSSSYFGTWVNQETSSVVDVGPFFEMRDGGEAFEWEFRSLTRPTPASSNYAVEIGLVCHAYAGGAGVIGYGSGGAVAAADIMFGTNTTRFAVFNTALLVDASHRSLYQYVTPNEPQPRMQAAAQGRGGVVFYRIRDDGTNRYYEVSLDRQTWVLIDQHARTTHTIPTTWGPTIATGRLAAQQARVLFVHGREYTI
jgi:hypothetical protein